MTKINREQKRTIPGRHSVILAKVSELSNGNIPLEALQELYLFSSNITRTEMIEKFLVEIKAECEVRSLNINITPKEKI